MVELMVVVGIIMLVGGGVVANYNNYNENQKVRQTALTLKNNLRFAQTKASQGNKPSSGCGVLTSYEVTLLSSSYELVPVCSTAGARVEIATERQTFSLPAGVTITTLTAFEFKVLTKGVNVSNVTPLTITLQGTGSSVYSMQLTSNGDIKDCGFAACP